MFKYGFTWWVEKKIQQKVSWAATARVAQQAGFRGVLVIRYSIVPPREFSEFSELRKKTNLIHRFGQSVVLLHWNEVLAVHGDSLPLPPQIHGLRRSRITQLEELQGR